MRFVLLSCLLHHLLAVVSSYWDDATVTPEYRADTSPRQSFFSWPEAQPAWYKIYWPHWDWDTMFYNRRTVVVAGVSIDFVPITTATILNRRTLITAANAMDPWFNRQRDLRVWALGVYGNHNTPYRYRVWRTTRLFPKSLNPEHWHGPRGDQSSRHDICIIHTLDQMFLFPKLIQRGMYPCRSYLVWKRMILSDDMWYCGSGYKDLLHIRENFKIFYTRTTRSFVVDCSKYIPKWWGKFICLINKDNFAGVQNGGGLHSQITSDYLFGLGCYEVRYNEDRIIVFTDLRYYVDWIYLYGMIYAGEYYEYAYPQWGVKIFTDNLYAQDHIIPGKQIQYDLLPLG